MESNSLFRILYPPAVAAPGTLWQSAALGFAIERLRLAAGERVQLVAARRR